MRIKTSFQRIRRPAQSNVTSRRHLMRAVGRLTRLARIEPGNFQVRFQLGLAYLRLGALDNALTCLNQAAFLNPQHYPVWTELGGLHERLGQHGEAIRAFETSLELQPNDAIARAHLARLVSATPALHGFAQSTSPSSWGVLVAALGVKRIRTRRP